MLKEGMSLNRKNIRQGTLVTDGYARALEDWRRLWRREKPGPGSHPAAIARALTGYLATLATLELTLTLTGGPRAAWLEEQFAGMRPRLREALEIAAAQGQCVLRPRVQGARLTWELIPGSRFYPIRYGPGGVPACGFFADFRREGREELVRLERFDWQEQEKILTVTNRAYRLRGEELDREIPLDTFEDWGKLEKRVVIQNASGPLFGVIRMPFPGPEGDLPGSLYWGAEESLREFDRLYGELL